jgi:hypothetical protein
MNTQIQLNRLCPDYDNVTEREIELLDKAGLTLTVDPNDENWLTKIEEELQVKFDCSDIIS